MELKETIEKIGTAFDEFKAANDKRLKDIETKGYAPADVVEKVEKINAELTSLAKMKLQLEAVETAVARSAFAGGGSSEVNKAKAEHKAGFNSWFRKGAEAGLRDLEIKAELSTLSDPDGGFTVPEEIDAAIDRVAATMSAMRRLATVRTIGTGTYKKLVGIGGATSGWVGEKQARPETDTPKLVEIAINTKEIYAMPAATQTLLDDSKIDIGQWLADEVSIEFDEQEGDAFINGNGVEQPHGIAAYPMVANAQYAWGKIGFIGTTVALLAATKAADAFIDLQHSLKVPYRNGASWLMNDLTLSAVRKLKDTQDNYIFQPGIVAGAPDILFGKPIEYDDNIGDVASGNFPVFYGNFKRAYLIIDRFGTRVLRDPYTKKPYVLFYTTRRVGGGIVMYEALKCLKITA